MTEDDELSQVSFPVTIWYEPETGNIHFLRRTDPVCATLISPDPRAPDGHAELYMSFLNLLMDAASHADRKADAIRIARLLGRARPSQ